MPEIGLQLYTLRQEVEKDIRGVLRELSSIGYRGVEFAFGYGGMEPRELGLLLRQEGLECAGIYADMRQALSPGSDAYRYAEAVGCRYIIGGITGMVSEREWPAAVGMVIEASAAAESMGMKFLYHNHWQELESIGGKTALDVMFDETSAYGVCFELDTGWLAKAGHDPSEYMERYAGRLPSVHMRDFSPDFEVSRLGDGIVDIPSAVSSAVRSGADWLVFEQSAGSFQTARSSYEKLAELQNKAKE